MKAISLKKLVVRIVLVFATVEIGAMLILEHIFPDLSSSTKIFLDVSILSIFSIPLIFLWAIRPYREARDQAIEKMNYLAFHDPLTQLANRRLMLEQLEKMMASHIRHQLYGAILAIDLDQFKPINDAYGHDAGDAVLVEISKRLSSVCRKEDLVSRSGGDELIVLLNHLDQEREAAHKKAQIIAEKLQKLLHRPISHRGNKLEVTASIGIRLIGEGDDDSLGAAIREADSAMYSAKQAGGGLVAFFEK